MANTSSARKAARVIATSHRGQQGAALAAAHLHRQGRGGARLRRPRQGGGGAEGSRAGHHARLSEGRVQPQRRTAQGVAAYSAREQARQVTADRDNRRKPGNNAGLFVFHRSHADRCPRRGDCFECRRQRRLGLDIAALAVVKTSRTKSIVSVSTHVLLLKYANTRIARRCAGATLCFRSRKFVFAERFNGKATRRTLNLRLLGHSDVTRFEQNCRPIAHSSPQRRRA